jgi:hypothetical protein
MLIECLVQRSEPVEVPIGNEKYRFEEDGHGRKVAEVWLEDHVECFLAVTHLYRKADEIAEPEIAPPAPTRRAPAIVRPGVDDMKRREIMAELKEHEIKFDVRAKTDDLRDALAAARCA